MSETIFLKLPFEFCTNIEELDLTSHKFKTIPSAFSKLTTLKRLKMNRNEISEPPKEWIVKLTDLEELHLRFNSIREWPLSLLKMTSLRYLNLGYNNLKDISFGLFQNLGNQEFMPSLTHLDLSSNYFTQWPSRVSRFPNLKIFHFNNNTIKMIPHQINKLKALEDFSASQCSLSEIPKGLSELKIVKLNVSNNPGLSLKDLTAQLQECDISRCDIVDVSSLTAISSLIKVEASMNKIKSLGSLKNWKLMTELDLSKNNLTIIDEEFGFLESLRVLNLSNNQISEIRPKVLSTTIQVLRIRENALTSMDGIVHLVNLKELDVSQNQIKDLQCSGMNSLQSLKCSHNLISSCMDLAKTLHLLDASSNTIVDSIQDYPFKATIQHMNLEHNFISNIVGIENFPELITLELSYNEMSELPAELITLGKLTCLSISQNSLEFKVLPQKIDQWIKDQNIRLYNNFESPDEIIKGLFLGSFASASNRKYMKSLGITHVLAVAREVTPLFKSDFEYLWIPILDSSATTLRNYHESCFEFIDKAIESNGGVLIHCVAGVSRSASITISYLMSKSLDTFENTFNLVLSKRPTILPNDSFRKQMRQYQIELTIDQQ